MAVELVIHDGDPWYLSPDIWVVPGSDPLGEIGLPTVDKPAFIWARVHNEGTTPVSSARVNYYWADPSMVLTPATATLIGSSFVSLTQEEAKEVLCLVPWTPVWVNDGHECLIVEAYHPDDPISRGPNESFNPGVDRHVAQRNIGVLEI